MKSKTAFLWDESFLWGLMAYEALKKNNLPFEIVSSEDIKKNGLNDYSMLFVPGGWASNKLKALGDIGINEIKSFVRKGGSYFGICGGAGLATLDGIGLIGIKRMHTKDRIPSFSGRIRLRINEHQIWQGLTDKQIFHAWWPSQFVIEDKGIRILATYREAMPDAFSSDLCIGDIANSGQDWAKLESLYKINLNPSKLINEPAVLEGIYGKGKIILSLIHFDTPEDEAGYIVLKNTWEYLCKSFIETHKSMNKAPMLPASICNADNGFQPSKMEVGDDLCSFTGCNLTHPYRENIESMDVIFELVKASQELIRIGERNFLWFQRNPILFQWRRGVRGLEYCNLYMLIKKIAQILNICGGITDESVKSINSRLLRIKEIFLPFFIKAKQLLIMERIAIQNGNITYEKCDDNLIQTLRHELFSTSKSYGGMYKKLINEIDKLLFDLIRNSCSQDF